MRLPASLPQLPPTTASPLGANPTSGTGVGETTGMVRRNLLYHATMFMLSGLMFIVGAAVLLGLPLTLLYLVARFVMRGL